jgi:hypothetical protein
MFNELVSSRPHWHQSHDEGKFERLSVIAYNLTVLGVFAVRMLGVPSIALPIFGGEIPGLLSKGTADQTEVACNNVILVGRLKDVWFS